MMGVPLLFTFLQLLGSEVMILFSIAGPIARASISLGMYNVWEGLCVMGLVGSASIGGWGLWVFVTFGAPRASIGVSVLAVIED